MTGIPSPWRRWRHQARFIAILVFVGASSAGCLLLHFSSLKAIDWPSHVADIQGTVVHLRSDYQTKPMFYGQQKPAQQYSVVYRFELKGAEYVSQVGIGNAEYRRYQVGKPIELVYNPADPAINDTLDNYQARHQISLLVLKILPVTFVGSVFLYLMLLYFYARNNDDQLHEGFYTEHSWIDVERRQVVFLHRGDLYYFDIDPKQVDKVREAYQRGVDCNSLRLLSRSSYFRHLPLNEITRLSSQEHSTQLEISHKAQRHVLKFMNSALKNHALEQISHYLPDYMQYQESGVSVIQAGTPWLLAILGLSLLAVIMHQLAVYAICGGLIVAILLPKLLMVCLQNNRQQVWDNRHAQGIVI